MLRLDTTKLTPETVAFAKLNNKLAIKNVLVYCIKHRMNVIKIKTLYDRIVRISDRAYQMRTIDPVAIDGVLPTDVLYRFAPHS